MTWKLMTVRAVYLDPLINTTNWTNCFLLFHSNRFTDESDHTHYRLLEDKVCKFYAEYLLRPAGRVGGERLDIVTGNDEKYAATKRMG